MRIPVILPDLGAGPVRFGLWLVELGDPVYQGDRVAEVWLTGVSVDIAAPVTGRFTDRVAWPRDVLTPGQVLGYVEPEEDGP
jgi:pyruvate/2-oxoglutarate dehydrogenase complex dihydrolipoamide acyltransferase (E2) component